MDSFRVPWLLDESLCGVVSLSSTICLILCFQGWLGCIVLVYFAENGATVLGGGRGARAILFLQWSNRQFIYFQKDSLR